MVRIRSKHKKGDAVIRDEVRGVILRNCSFVWARNDEISVGDCGFRADPRDGIESLDELIPVTSVERGDTGIS